MQLLTWVVMVAPVMNVVQDERLPDSQVAKVDSINRPFVILSMDRVDVDLICRAFGRFEGVDDAAVAFRLVGPAARRAPACSRRSASWSRMTGRCSVPVTKVSQVSQMLA